MDEDLTAPRDLAEDEAAFLREMLVASLILSSPDDEEDAENLLEYAMDMVESGENVGHIVAELAFMEMPMCDEEVANNLGFMLTKFFQELDHDDDGGGSPDGGAEGGREGEPPELAPEPPTRDLPGKKGWQDELSQKIAATGRKSWINDPADGDRGYESPESPERALPEEPSILGRSEEPSAMGKSWIAPKHADDGADESSTTKTPEKPEKPGRLSLPSENSWIAPKDDAGDFRHKLAENDVPPAPPTEPGPEDRSSPERFLEHKYARSEEKYPSPKSGRERERKGQEVKERGPSPLKQRLVAFEGASSEKTLHEEQNNGDCKSPKKSTDGDDTNLTKEEMEQKKKREEKREQVRKQLRKRKTLKQRLAAYEDASSKRNLHEPEKNEEKDATSKNNADKDAAFSPDGDGRPSPPDLPTAAPSAREDRVAPKELPQDPIKPSETASPKREQDKFSPEEKASEERREREQKRAKLKERLAAYQGASTRKRVQQRQQQRRRERNDENVASSKIGAGTSENEDVAPKVEGAPRLSLKERMAAFQGGMSSAASAEEEEEVEEGEKEDEKYIIDDAPALSLKERMAAFQRGAPTAAPPAEEDEDEEEKEVDDTTLSMKDRMAAFQRRGSSANAPVKKGEEEPGVKDRASAFNPRQERRNTLQDRMAVFGQAKSTSASRPKAEKELTGLQQRMAVFSNEPPKKSSSAAATAARRRKGPHPEKVQPNGGGGGCPGLRDRMAKYVEMAGVSETDGIAATSRRKSAAAAAKRRSFAPKKPGGDLQVRMQKYMSTPDLSAGTDSKEERAKAVVGGDGKEQRKWKYQAKEAASASSSSIEKNSTKPRGSNRERDAGRTPNYRAEANKKWHDSSEKATPPEGGTDAGEGSEGRRPARAVSAGVPAGDVKTRLSTYHANVASPANNASSSKGLRPGESMPAGDLKGRMSIFQANAVSPDVPETSGKREPTEATQEEERSGNSKPEMDGEENEERATDHATAPRKASDGKARAEPTTEEAGGDESQEPVSDVAEQKSIDHDEGSSSSPVSSKASWDDLQDGQPPPFEAFSADAAQHEETDGECVPSSPVSESGGEELQDEAATPAAEISSPDSSPRLSHGSSSTVPTKNSEVASPEPASPEERSDEKRAEMTQLARASQARASQVADLLRDKKMEEERAKAELESLKSEAAEAERSLQASFGAVKSIAAEIEGHEANAKKAEAEVKAAEGKMKKGGILGVGKKKTKKEAYERALETLREEERKAKEAKDRLAAAWRESECAKRSLEECKQKTEEKESSLRELELASLLTADEFERKKMEVERIEFSMSQAAKEVFRHKRLESERFEVSVSQPTPEEIDEMDEPGRDRSPPSEGAGASLPSAEASPPLPEEKEPAANDDDSADSEGFDSFLTILKQPAEKEEGSAVDEAAAKEAAASPAPAATIEKECSSSSPVTSKSTGGSLQDRMAKFAEATSADASQKKKLERGRTPPQNPRSSSPRKESLSSNQVMANYTAASLREKTEKERGRPLPHNPRSLSVWKESLTPNRVMANEAAASSRDKTEKERKPPRVIPGVATAGSLQDRMAKFVEVSSADALQEEKPKEERSSLATAGSLQGRMAKFVEVSSADAFQKEKPKERRSSLAAAGSLQDRMAKFAVSSSDAFQNEKPKEERSSLAAAGSLQDRMTKFVELSSADAYEKESSAPPPPIDIQREVAERGTKPFSGKVVENRVTLRTMSGPKDYDYLYDLSVKLEDLKSEEHDIFAKGIGTEKEKQNGKQNGERKDVKASLERILGSATQYTAAADWLNKEWIDRHLFRDDRHNSLKFRFRDHMLFKRFDKTSREKRDRIIHIFITKLLLHAKEITQLDLSSCLLPDKFLQVLAEEVLKNPAESFPNLQLVNFESNLLEGPGIEALSEVIRNEHAWPYLQAVMLENQKHSMTSEAERFLADAVGLSPSIVVCSVTLRNLYLSADINDAILYNVNQLRLARRDRQAKEGTLKERRRNEMELYFDGLAADESDVSEVVLVGDQKFLILDDEEKTKSGAAFSTNTSVKTVKMELLGLGDDFAKAFGEAIAKNDAIERVNIDSNAITGAGMRALFEGLGKNASIEEFQARHQRKPMATSDEEALPDLVASNTSLLKLGVDVRSQLVRMKLDRIVGANRDRARKLRAEANRSC